MDLARAGLVASRNVADLDVADVPPRALQAVRDGAFLHLHVEGVEAQFHVGACDAFNHLHALSDAVVEELGKARTAARLQDQADAGRFGLVRGPGDVLHEQVDAAGAVELWSHVSRHDVDHGPADLSCVLHGPVDAAAEILLPPRQRTEPALSAVPVEGRENLHEFQAVVRQACREFLRRHLVGEGHFHAAEAGRGGRGVTVRHRQFGEEPAQIGVEAQHA
jgi:hypothetical protein